MSSFHLVIARGKFLPHEILNCVSWPSYKFKMLADEPIKIFYVERFFVECESLNHEHKLQFSLLVVRKLNIEIWYFQTSEQKYFKISPLFWSFNSKSEFRSISHFTYDSINPEITWMSKYFDFTTKSRHNERTGESRDTKNL